MAVDRTASLSGNVSTTNGGNEEGGPLVSQLQEDVSIATNGDALKGAFRAGRLRGAMCAISAAITSTGLIMASSQINSLGALVLGVFGISSVPAAVVLGVGIGICAALAILLAAIVCFGCHIPKLS